MTLFDFILVVLVTFFIYRAVTHPENLLTFPGHKGDIETKLWINERLLYIALFLKLPESVVNNLERRSKVYHEIVAKNPVYRVKNDDRMFVSILKGVSGILLAIIVIVIIGLIMLNSSG